MDTSNLPHSTQLLIADIKKKDRRFRIAQSIFFVLITGLLMFLLVGNYRQQSTSQTLIQNQTKTLDKLASNSKRGSIQIKDLQNHIDCIVALFQQPNRSNIVITDLEHCSLKQL